MTVQGIVRGNTVLIDGEDLKDLDGERVTVTLIKRRGVTAETMERRRNYLAEMDKTLKPSGRTTAEIDAEIRESRRDRF